MANLHDYLKWRGDLPFAFVPLSEPDGLTLTRFAYMPFESVQFDSMETIGSLCKKLKKLPEEQFRLEGDLRFVKLLEDADRFNQLPVTDFVKENDEKRVIQFAAVTIHLPEEMAYIAYCGTDSTLLGWKEDFYMSFMEDVPAQRAALAYATRIADQYPGKKLILGGHSKGGNLAIYAAVNLPEEQKARIVHVSDYDGPGFPQDYIDSHDFGTLLDRLESFLPQESMVGRIHEHAKAFNVVESTEKGLNQHNVYSWKVRRTELKRLEQTEESSEVAYHTIRNVLNMTSPEQRHQYVDTVFDLLSVKDVVDLSDLGDNLSRVGTNVLKTLSKLPADEWDDVQDINAALVKAYLEAMREVHMDKLPDVSDLVEKIPLKTSMQEITDFLKI